MTHYRPNVLVVCGRNKKRSLTAEHIFKNDPRCSIRSVGVSPQSNRKITEKDLYWADVVLVMEPEHKQKIYSMYRSSMESVPTIKILHIEDIYEYMHPTLVEILTEKINDILSNQL